jgi:hypothetical protein
MARAKYYSLKVVKHSVSDERDNFRLSSYWTDKKGGESSKSRE